jgi:hypothetical protein
VTVVVQDTSGRKVRLKASQERLFLDELGRARRQPSSTELPPRLGPDCSIRVSVGGNTTEYALYGRTVIGETATGKNWQFYFGLVVLEWLAH